MHCTLPTNCNFPVVSVHIRPRSSVAGRPKYIDDVQLELKGQLHRHGHRIPPCFSAQDVVVDRMRTAPPPIFLELVEIFSLFGVTDTTSAMHVFDANTESVHTLHEILGLRREPADRTEFVPVQAVRVHTTDSAMSATRNAFSYIYTNCTSATTATDYARDVLFGLLTALRAQKKGGVSIFKVREITQHALIVDALHMLCYLFEKVHIYKPGISDLASDHRYVVCVNFRPTEHRYALHDTILAQIQGASAVNLPDTRFLASPVPLYVMDRICEISVVIEQARIEYFTQTLNMLVGKSPDDKIECARAANANKGAQWMTRFLEHK
jgi:hypothetical protein